MAELDRSDRALRGRIGAYRMHATHRLARDLDAWAGGLHGLVRAPRRPGRNPAAGRAGSASGPCPLGPLRQARLPVGEGPTEALGSAARRSMRPARAPLDRAGPALQLSFVQGDFVLHRRVSTLARSPTAPPGVGNPTHSARRRELRQQSSRHDLGDRLAVVGQRGTSEGALGVAIRRVPQVVALEQSLEERPLGRRQGRA
jgi:hypothetical protein